MKKLKSYFAIGLILAGFSMPVLSVAQQTTSQEKTKKQTGATEHIMLAPSELKWSAAPSSLPSGAQVAVMEGDPSKKGPFTMRIKLPANYKIPAHWHPGLEHVTVIEGSFMLGMGDTFDESKLHELPTGGFAVMPAKMNHFAMSRDGAIIQLHGTGPWGITYVNPQDNPASAGTR